MAEQRDEVPTVVCHDDSGGREPRGFRDVCVVDPATRHPVAGGVGQESRPAAGGKVQDLEPRQDFRFHQRARLLRLQPQPGGQPRGDRVELQAAVPGRHGGADGAADDGVEYPAGGERRLTQLDEPREQDGRVEEHRTFDYGHRLRSSSMSAATSMAGRSFFATVGRATSLPFTRTSVGGGVVAARRIPDSSTESSSLVPARSPSRSRTIAGITILPAPSMVTVMARVYHWDGSVVGVSAHPWRLNGPRRDTCRRDQ